MYDQVCDAFGCGSIPIKYRIGIWGACLVTAFCLSLGTLAFIQAVIDGNPDSFVISYTFAHIITFTGSMFLSTPKKFFIIAFDSNHWGATTFYLFTIFITLFIVYYPGIEPGGRIAVIVLAMIVQYMAYVWFCLSQLPFGARIQKIVCRSFMDCRDCKCCNK